MQDPKIKSQLRNYPWIDVPCHSEVLNLLKKQDLSDTYYSRGSGKATNDLENVERQHRKWVSDIIDLSSFPYCYFVNGVTDAIHHWKITETRDCQTLFHGEYAYPDMILSSSTVGQDCDKATYISIPSATDGDMFDPGDIEMPVILDCTYVGTTGIQKINVPVNTEQVFFGFSKAFGLVGQRLGLVYTKQPHPVLDTLKRFENWNYAGVKTIELLLKSFRVDEMWDKYCREQIEICKHYEFQPSDCFFLATTQDPYYKKRRRMPNNDNARICITPLIKGNIHG